MLTEEQIDLIRDSAGQLAELNIAATNTFYANLFKTAPEVRTLFPEDMFEQSEKLWQSIVMVVESADDLVEIQDALKALGARHVGYGAKPEHYVVVTNVLIETIAVLMQDTWTEDHRQAWEAALKAVCVVMLEGASTHAA
ncbi:MAG: hemin receptor [Hyphomicrobiales bacterium]|nr:hemin receptor [Hyphomicrobiales bacterium]